MTILASSRLTAYYNEDVSREVAKLIPLALLGVFIVDPTYFSMEVVVDRFLRLPSMLYLILQYLSYIVVLELALRLIHNIREIFRQKASQPKR